MPSYPKGLVILNSLDMLVSCPYQGQGVQGHGGLGVISLWVGPQPLTPADPITYHPKIFKSQKKIELGKFYNTRHFSSSIHPSPRNSEKYYKGWGWKVCKFNHIPKTIKYLSMSGPPIRFLAWSMTKQKWCHRKKSILRSYQNNAIQKHIAWYISS